MNKPLVTINLVVNNGEKYLRYCLDHVRRQTYENLEVNVFDNASIDSTRDIVQREYPEFNLIAHPQNLGMWPGQEEALKSSHGFYIVGLSVDVMMHPQFVKNAIRVCEADPLIGALQAKILRYDFQQLADGSYDASKIIDTCGFRLARSRRVMNVGHGAFDYGQHDQATEIFAAEGAVPFFKKEALEAIRIDGAIVDHDYFWYGDDLDLTWRMQLFGWKQWYDPDVIAYHDRSTTKGHSRSMMDYFRRVKTRQQIPIRKRILDWSNVRFTIIKNDYIINILKDAPYIAIREIQVLGFALLFEPQIFLEIPRFLGLLPAMLRKRRLVMAKAKKSPQEMHTWFI
ncbi:MAG: glycosyltransferase [Patescibacteria group bacterium]